MHHHAGASSSGSDPTHQVVVLCMLTGSTMWACPVAAAVRGQRVQ